MRNASRDSVLAERLARPQRLGIFGHRGVGKTTLITMLYREAVAGRLPGIRLAAGETRSAEYFADKIAQLEAGQLLPATLAETELRLNLYHNQTRIELEIRDYQGEHVELGRDETIHDFLRDCDAVWLCVDATLAPRSADLLRRQQEMEQLIEHYLKVEPGLVMDRPFALILTKCDLLPRPNANLWADHLGMTCHALETHCSINGLFAVSSLCTKVDAVETRPQVEEETGRNE
ncbi:MAG: GTPase domain-containing protein, partial [Gemmataceae bacterium]